MIMLSPANWPDYELIDCGNAEKLERFGAYILARPEPKALWDKSLSEKEWNGLVHTRFVTGAGFGKAGREDSGTWQMVKKMPEQWPITYKYDGLAFTMRLGLTAFKHVGIFPEQAPNWNYIYTTTTQLSTPHSRHPTPRHPTPHSPLSTSHSPRSTLHSHHPTLHPPLSTHPKILNLFAYTGAASLAARAAGADVTHLDAVRQVVTWARTNMELSGMDGVRWIVEDALKFVKRQVRRGVPYQGIILDPPAYGHGPEGERWKLDECLFELLRECNAILAPEHSFVLLNLYSNGYSALLAETLVRQAFGLSGQIVGEKLSFGELFLEDRFGKRLPLSVFVRMER
jgi:23S rRNA (cytosine1962-C5)-methyltransferase